MATTKVCLTLNLFNHNQKNDIIAKMNTNSSMQEATVILLDVGQQTGESFRSGQPTFFEQAKECLAKILQRKVKPLAF